MARRAGMVRMVLSERRRQFYDLGVYNVTTFTGLLGPVKEVVGMETILNATRKVEDQGEVKVEADETRCSL